MKVKDYNTMAIQQVVEHVNRACRFEKDRARLKLKSCAWILLQRLDELVLYTAQCEQEIRELRQQLKLKEATNEVE